VLSHRAYSIRRVTSGEESHFKTANLVKTVNLVNLAACFFNRLEKLQADLHAILPADLPAISQAVLPMASPRERSRPVGSWERTFSKAPSKLGG
jgi:hypothetical protein